jgi:hypothetical protein
VYGTADAKVSGGVGSTSTMQAEGRAQVFDSAGVNDPAMTLDEQQAAARSEEGKALGGVRSAETDARKVQGYVADPSGSARTAATDAGQREAIERAPVNPADVQADFNVASQTVADPATAGEARVEVAVDAEVRGTTPKTPK